MTQTPCMHVIPDRRGGWRVQRDGDREPVSHHASETEAERHARELGARTVVVHDRYDRVHQVRA